MLIKCQECSAEISDKAKTCPNCGCPIFYNEEPLIIQSNIPIQDGKGNKKEKKKSSSLSIWACILALLKPTIIIAGILGVIDLIKKDKTKKHIGSWFAIIMCLLYVGLVLPSESDDKKEDTKETITINSNESTESPTHKENSKDKDKNNKTDKDNNKNEESQISAGGSFDVDGLNISINEVSTNYTNYDDEYGFHSLEKGTKYVMVSFTCTNNSKKDRYVSIYDYECYADGSLCEQYYGLGGDFINTNLSSGRKVTFSTYYIAPSDAKNIELEYTKNIWTDEKVIIKIK